MHADIHCHLHLLEDVDAAISRARAAGVQLIMTNGLDPATNERSLALERQYPEVRAALGLYPNDALLLDEARLDAQLEMIARHEPAAIGEVGLDLHHDKEHLPEMRAIFERVVGVAERTGRPLIVHSRKAEAEVLDVLESSRAVANLHCFGGSLKLVRRAVQMGCHLSIPANVTRATHFQRLVEEVPLSQLLSETDSPYLSPDDQPNEPANVALVAAEVARLKGMDLIEAGNQLWMNARRFLR